MLDVLRPLAMLDVLRPLAMLDVLRPLAIDILTDSAQGILTPYPVTLYVGASNEESTLCAHSLI